MSLLDRKRFGAVIRVFAKTPEQVARNVAQATEAAHRMLGSTAGRNMVFRGKRLFSEVLILVAADKNYPDHDCGLTAAALRKNFAGVSNVAVLEVRHGDLFCGVLNYGAAKLLRNRCDYMCVLSHGALSYLTEPTLVKVLEKFESGAKSVGVAFEDLAESVLEGRIANTFAFWDLEALGTVGLFDYSAAQVPLNDTSGRPAGGVEEIIPLLRLAEVFGTCIATVVPDAAGAKWMIPDQSADPEGYERHMKKMQSKLARQEARAAADRKDLKALKSALMR